jgi:hypothetical protein
MENRPRPTSDLPPAARRHRGPTATQRRRRGNVHHVAHPRPLQHPMWSVRGPQDAQCPRDHSAGCMVPLPFSCRRLTGQGGSRIL